MARRKNVKRIDPRYFLNETVSRNDDGSRLEEDLDEVLEEEEIEEGVFSYPDPAGLGSKRAKELDAEDLDASGEERLAFEKDPRGYSRHQHAISRSNTATNPPGKQDINQFLKQDYPEVWAAWNQEQEIEEGFKDFVQGTKDTFRDVTKGRKLGKTRQIRKDAEEARRLDAEEEAARPAREKARKDRAAAEKQERIRAANAAMSRGADRMRRGSTSKDDEDLEYRRDRMDPDRHARRERERERRHSGFGSDHYVEQE